MMFIHSLYHKTAVSVEGRISDIVLCRMVFGRWHKYSLRGSVKAEFPTVIPNPD